MQFQQFYLNCLAHASYLVGSDGVCAIIDPQRDVEIYLEEAAKRKLRITHIIETHLHADFISGHIELARRTGARILIGARAGASFDHEAVHDAGEVRLGKVLLSFLETPGHTVEGICVVVSEKPKTDKPWAVLTGDTLFIGDVGRPDLCPQVPPEELAGQLYDSLHGKLLTLPDSTLVYPAHGAGSLCGRSLSHELCSTIGEQRRSNYALLAESREEFISLMTADLPERPSYFAYSAEMNRRGATPLYDLPPLPVLEPAAFAQQAAAGAAVLDTRPSIEFMAGHSPGSVNIGLAGQFASWAGSLFGPGARLLLVAEDPERLEEATVRLTRVGIEGVTGALAGGFPAWRKAGLPVESIPEIAADELRRRRLHGPPVTVLDVRKKPEWEAGHMEGAQWLPLHELPDRITEVSREKQIAVQCQSGYRSAIACSLLAQRGFRNISNVIGGWNAWTALARAGEPGGD
jgi:glyoxylase-like metal-dependent hydrolase (beta-lactamase superfamily II)